MGSPAVGHLAVSDEAAAFALWTEAEILKHHDHRAGEAVVDAGHVDVGGPVAGHLVGQAARFDRAGDGKRRHQEDMLVRVAFAAAENVDRLLDRRLRLACSADVKMKAAPPSEISEQSSLW